MAEKVSITVTAYDGASKTFTAIAGNAAKLGDALQKAAEEGGVAFDRVDTAAKRTKKSMDDFEDVATKVGAAMGTLVGTTALIGASYRDQQRQIDAINRAYGDQADEILAVTEQIQDYTRFSNDAAREGALFATALVDAYGLTGDQVGILLERSADLAQMYGISLPDAIMRTAGAIRGEGEAAERLGLNMSDAAIAARALQDGITNWNVPGALSEAEKAAYRFQVFLEDTEQSVGAAADATENAGGRFRQFINDVQDAEQVVGGFLGPVGEVAAEMAPIAIALPIVGAGLGKFGGWLRNTSSGAKVAAASMTALRFAISPLGLGLAGIVAIGGGIVAGWLNQKRAADEYKHSLEALNDTIFQLEQGGSTALATQAKETTANLEALAAAYEKARPSRDDFPTFQGEDPSVAFEAYNEATDNFIDRQVALGANITKIQDNINEALSHPEIDATAYLDWIDRLTTQAASTNSEFDDLAVAAMLADTSLEEFNQTTQVAVDLSGKFARELQEVESRAKSAGDAVKSGVTDRIDNLNQATTDWLSNGDNILRFWLELTEGANQGSAAFDGTAAELEAFQAQMDAAADFRALVQLAEDADNAAEALDAVLRTFQQIDELGQRSATAGSIAESIIGTEDQIGIAQQLLDAGRISLMEYQGAISAGTAIQQSNLAVQEDLNAMRVAQLPLLAAEQLAYEQMIDQISQLGPLEQRRALALMDSNVQAQIAQQYATAYSASIGEIPEEVATQLIVNAAEADPVLKDILLQMELITEEDGEIKVNFPDGPSVQESVMALTESIDALTLAMGGIPPLRIEADTQQALAEALGVKAAVDDLDGTTATVHADAEVNSANGKINSVEANLNDLDGSIGTVIAETVDNASGKLGNVMSLVRALDGLTATTHVVTAYSTTGAPPPRGIPGASRAMGGLVGYAAGGLIPFRAAEGNRPEMLHLANGGQVPLMTDSIYAAPANSYVAPHNANTNYSQGGDTFVFNIAPGNDVDGIRRFMRDEFLPSFKGEMDRHKVAVTGGAQ